MFQKNDYLEYFDNLYKIELGMEKEGRLLLKIIDDPLARKLLQVLIKDEMRHKKIVKDLIKTIK